MRRALWQTSALPFACSLLLSRCGRVTRRQPGTSPRHAENHSPDRRRDQGRRAPGEGRRRAARRRRHRALHRPLPQGGHRRPRRHPAARARGAPGLPARARRAPRGGAEEHRRAGQAHARAARRHRGRADQAGAGRPLPAVQAQAPHQGPDRARGRHRAAGRQAVRRPDARSAAEEAAAFVKPAADGLDFATVPLVLDGVRDILSERWAEDAALVQRLREWLWAEGPVQVQADGRQGREPPRRRQVPRLLRLRRADRPRALAPRAGGVPRPRAGDPRRQAGAAGGARAGQALDRRRQDRAAPGLEPCRPRRPTT